MTVPPKDRCQAVMSAVDEMRGLGNFWNPLRELEATAIEPLPDFDHFLSQWLRLVEERAGKKGDAEWDRDEDRWLREVVQRTQGPDGLAELARTSKRADDLNAWCRALVESGDWAAALAAYDEAAKLVRDKEYSQGDFLDGAALAAQQLARGDLPARLERAWREAPSMVRLRRWLGSSETREALKRRVAEGLDVCPTKARRQRAVLHVLDDDFTSAARLLTAAPGLGWSDDDHPGHLLFSLFARLLGGVAVDDEYARDLDELALFAGHDEPQLVTPDLNELLKLASVREPSDEQTRALIIKAMRKAAEKRIAGVTGKGRRRYYGHAASLALACAEVDGTPEGMKWLGRIHAKYRRYPALQRELRAREHQQ